MGGDVSSGGGSSKTSIEPTAPRRYRESAISVPSLANRRARVPVVSTIRRTIFRVMSAASLCPKRLSADTAPSPMAAANSSAWVLSRANSVSISVLLYSPIYNMPLTKIIRASKLTARIRRVIGEIRRAFTGVSLKTYLLCSVSVSYTVESFDVLELFVNFLELFTQPFDVAVDGSIIHV